MQVPKLATIMNLFVSGHEIINAFYFDSVNPENKNIYVFSKNNEKLHYEVVI